MSKLKSKTNPGAYGPKLDAKLVSVVSAFVAQTLPSAHEPNICDRPFVDIAYHKFRIDQVAKLLKDPRKSYPFHKEALAHAFAAWVVAPTNAELRKQSVARVVSGRLQAIERQALRRVSKAVSNNELVLDQIFAMQIELVRSLGRDFYYDLYIPIGGMKAMYGIDRFDALTASQEDKIQVVLSFISVLHVRINTFSGSRYGKPSVSITASALQKINILRNQLANGAALRPISKTLSVNPRYLRECWYDLRDSVSFIYAASTIAISSDETLLTKLTNRNSSPAEHDHFRKLISRAKFVESHILGKLYDPPTAMLRAPWLGAQESFDPAPMANEEVEIIKNEFNKNESVASKTGRRSQTT